MAHSNRIASEGPKWRLAALALSLGAAAGLVGQAQAQKAAAKKEKSAAPAAQKLQFGDTVITSGEIDYDLANRQYIFTGKVDLLTSTTHMTSDKMTVQMNPDNEMLWAKCAGTVTVDKKNPEDGTTMTGTGDLLEYFDKQQKANLQGDVVVRQESPKLAKPAIITGSRVDLDLAKKVNVVKRSAGEQAKVHLEPKGEEGKPIPEPVDLLGNEIQMNSETQEYTATGQPSMVRPSSRIKADKINFLVDKKTNEVSVAHATDNVIFDAQSEKGSVVHATGDHSVFNKETNELLMEVSKTSPNFVHATVKDPEEEKPTVYQGASFLYNTKTGYRKLKADLPEHPAVIILPEKPKGQKSDTVPAAPGAPEKKDKKDAPPPAGAEKKK